MLYEPTEFDALIDESWVPARVEECRRSLSVAVVGGRLAAKGLAQTGTSMRKVVESRADSDGRQVAPKGSSVSPFRQNTTVPVIVATWYPDFPHN